MKFIRSASRWAKAHENRVWIYCLMAGAPAMLFCIYVLAAGGYEAKVQWTIGTVVFGFWWAMAWSAREKVVSPLRTLSNLLEAMRELQATDALLARDTELEAILRALDARYIRPAPGGDDQRRALLEIDCAQGRFQAFESRLDFVGAHAALRLSADNVAAQGPEVALAYQCEGPGARELQLCHAHAAFEGTPRRGLIGLEPFIARALS